MSTADSNWFIYAGNRQEGPITADEVRARVARGALQPTDFVWKEGMQGWQPLSGVPELQHVSPGPPPPPAPLPSPPPSPAAVAPPPPVVSAPPPEAFQRSTYSRASTIAIEAEHPPFDRYASSSDLSSIEIQGDLEERTDQLDAKNLRLANKEAARAARVAKKGESAYLMRLAQEAGKPRTIKLAVGVLAFLVLALLAYSVGFMNSSRLPDSLQALIGTWVSPIPELPDVSKEELGGLRSAARAPIKDRVRFALALGAKTQKAPIVYVASNLPDGARFDLYVHGKRGTLLDQPRYDAHFEIRQSRKLSRLALTQIPIGQYTVYVLEGSEQPAEVKAFLSGVTGKLATLGYPPRRRRILASVSSFLGGSADESYRGRLKTYRDELRIKSLEEMRGFQDLSSRIAKLISTLRSNVAQIRKKPNRKARLKSWTTFHSQWGGAYQALQDEVKREYLSRKVPESMRDILKEANSAVGSENLYLQSAAKDAKTLDDQYRTSILRADAMMTNLKSEISTETQRLSDSNHWTQGDEP